MSDIQSKVYTLYSLEQMSSRKSFVHQLHPMSKLIATMMFLICVLSVGRYDIEMLSLFLFYPIVVMALGDVPYKMIATRILVALPFCLCVGVANLFFDSVIVAQIGAVSISGGVISLFTLIIKVLLCVSSVLILVAITPFSYITSQLRCLHIPEVLVVLFEMTYRFIGVLVEESSSMIMAFRLRSNGARWPRIKDFSVFIGQLFLRSFDRAQRVYQAMQCRLYGAKQSQRKFPSWRLSDWVFVLLVGMSCVLFRFIRISNFLGGAL